MTTLTRTRTHKHHGEHDVITLAVSGDAGAVAAMTAAGVPISPWACSPTGDPDDLMHVDCPVHSDGCYGEYLGGSTSTRVRSAWLDGADAVYAALEELHREEFGA